MADQSDVESALVTAATAALYPDGTGGASVPGPDCRIYRGWPNSTALNADLADGKINVTVFPGGNTARTTTRYSETWMGAPAQPRLTVSVNDASVTFGGMADVGQVAGILVDGVRYAYRIRSGDTPELVAATLASMIRGRSIVQLSDSTLTIAGARDLVARVVADAPVQQEVRRQEQDFRITCWCPTPAIRDVTAATIDRAISGIRFLPLADGATARLTYAGTMVFDQSQNARLYRRDINYLVEYPTIISSNNPAMLFGNVVLNSTSITA